HAVMNLVMNAIRHAPDSENIDVRVRRDEGEALLEVEDYGPGIPPEDLPHIFQRFFQSSKPPDEASPGLGLGLYIAQGIANAHGGRIEVHSELGHGTRFTLHLPIEQETDMRRSASRSADSAMEAESLELPE